MQFGGLVLISFCSKVVDSFASDEAINRLQLVHARQGRRDPKYVKPVTLDQEIGTRDFLIEIVNIYKTHTDTDEEINVP